MGKTEAAKAEVVAGYVESEDIVHGFGSKIKDKKQKNDEIDITQEAPASMVKVRVLYSLKWEQYPLFSVAFLVFLLTSPRFYISISSGVFFKFIPKAGRGDRKNGN